MIGNLTKEIDAFAMEMNAFHFEDQSENLDVGHAIKTHLAWKGRLMAIIEKRSKETLDPEIAAMDSVCVLGKWLYGSRVNRNHSSFPSLMEKHREFHLCAGEILRLFNKGDIGKAQNLLSSKLNEYTREVIRLLNAF